MKQLTLELKERILIVEIEKEELVASMLVNDFFPNLKLEIVCEGSELTEEIAEGLAHSMNFGTEKYPDIGYLHSIKDNYWAKTALESFISGIEKHGYYWGENPIEEPIMHQLLGADENPNSEEKEWKEAESKTFNPEKTIIFEIL